MKHLTRKTKAVISIVSAIVLVLGTMTTLLVFNAAAAGYHDGTVTVGTTGATNIVNMGNKQYIDVAGENNVVQLRFADSMGIAPDTTLTKDDGFSIAIECNECGDNSNGSWYRMSDSNYVDSNDRHEMFWWQDSPLNNDNKDQGWKTFTIFSLDGSFHDGAMQDSGGNTFTQYTVNASAAGYDITFDSQFYCYISYIEVNVGSATATWGAKFTAQDGANFLPVQYNRNTDPNNYDGWKKDTVDGTDVLRTNNTFYPSLFLQNVFNVIPAGTDSITCEVQYMALTDAAGGTQVSNNDNENFMLSYRKLNADGTDAGNGDEDMRINTSNGDRGVWLTQTWVTPAGGGSIYRYGMKSLTLKTSDTMYGIAVKSIKVYATDAPDKYLLWDPAYVDPTGPTEPSAVYARVAADPATGDPVYTNASAWVSGSTYNFNNKVKMPDGNYAWWYSTGGQGLGMIVDPGTFATTDKLELLVDYYAPMATAADLAASTGLTIGVTGNNNRFTMQSGDGETQLGGGTRMRVGLDNSNVTMMTDRWTVVDCPVISSNNITNGTIPDIMGQGGGKFGLQYAADGANPANGGFFVRSMTLVKYDDYVKSSSYYYLDCKGNTVSNPYFPDGVSSEYGIAVNNADVTNNPNSWSADGLVTTTSTQNRTMFHLNDFSSFNNVPNVKLRFKFSDTLGKTTFNIQYQAVGQNNKALNNIPIGSDGWAEATLTDAAFNTTSGVATFFAAMSGMTLERAEVIKADSADKTALKAAIAADAVADTSLYTAESVAAYNTALDAAKTVDADMFAIQPDVDAATAALNSAFDALETVTTTTTEATTATTTTEPTNPPAVNIALNKTAYADHSEVQNNPPRLPGLAVDGDTSGSNSRWSSGDSSSDPVIDHWWMVDLGASYDLTGVELYWEAAFAKSYEIQVSNTDPGVIADDQGTCGDTGDFSSFTTIYSEDNNTTGGHQTIDLTGTGRYLRILCHEGYVVSVPAAFYGYSLFEVEVYGAPTPVIPLVSWYNGSGSADPDSPMTFGDNWFWITTGLTGTYNVDMIFDYSSTKSPGWQQFKGYADADGTHYTNGGIFDINDGFQNGTPMWYDPASTSNPVASTMTLNGLYLGHTGKVFNDAKDGSLSDQPGDFAIHICNDPGVLSINGIKMVVKDPNTGATVGTFTWGQFLAAPPTTTTTVSTTTTTKATTTTTTGTVTTTVTTATDTTTGTETGTTDTATTAAPTTVTHTTAAPTTTASETAAPTDDARTLLTNAVGAALTADQLAGYTDADAVAAYTAALANANAALANANATDQELTDALTALNNAKTALNNTLTTAAPTTTATAPSQTGVAGNLIPVGILGIAALGLTAVLAKKKSKK